MNTAPADRKIENVNDWTEYQEEAQRANYTLESFLSSLAETNSNGKKPEHVISGFDFRGVYEVQPQVQGAERFTKEKIISKDELTDLLDSISFIGDHNFVSREEVKEAYQAMVDSSADYHQSISVIGRHKGYVRELPAIIASTLEGTKNGLISASVGAGVGAVVGSVFAAGFYLITGSQGFYDPSIGFTVVPGVFGFVGGFVGYMHEYPILNFVADQKAKKATPALKEEMDEIALEIEERENDYKSALSRFYELTKDLPSSDQVKINDDASPAAVGNVSKLYEKMESTVAAVGNVIDTEFEFRLPEHTKAMEYFTNLKNQQSQEV